MEKRHRSTPSNSMLVPYTGGGDCQLAVVPASRFTLPRGWRVEIVPRANGSHSDKYYYERKTGRKFRSTLEVQRYLNGEGYPLRTTRNSPLRNHVSGQKRVFLSEGRNYECRRLVVSGGKLLTLDDDNASGTHSESAPLAPYILPEGWIVEEVPRRSDTSCVDKYYYEPWTGEKFRSLVAVENYLADLEENKPLSKALEEIKESKPLPKVFKLKNQFKTFPSRKTNITEENQLDPLDPCFTAPPMKVNWILASERGNVWKPFISETLVPDSDKQQWKDRLMKLMDDGIK